MKEQTNILVVGEQTNKQIKNKMKIEITWVA